MQSYDNLKAVVDAILAGKERRFNRRFLALANHYLFEPVACTPESGWGKGQIENRAGNIREWDSPTSIRTVKGRLLKQPKGGRAFVSLLQLASETGLEALQVTCELSLETGVVSASIVANELRRLTTPERVKNLGGGCGARLDARACRRYGRLREICHAH